MSHLAEECNRLKIEIFSVKELNIIDKHLSDFHDVCLLILPLPTHDEKGIQIDILNYLIDDVVKGLGEDAILITIGETVDLVHTHSKLAPSMQYQLWVAIKRNTPKIFECNSALPEHHFGALVHTKKRGSLNHTKTRIEYTYCPACDKTTKDYGGKKHTYNSYGTLISDVWRDISADLKGDLINVIERFADLFGLPPYRQLLVLDCRNYKQTALVTEERARYTIQSSIFNSCPEKTVPGQLIIGDVLAELGKMPDNSVDFTFADPPYNLKKNYNGYADDLSIAEYFDWCDKWISELGRILRPGRTCAILNIPLWAIRHFLHMERILQFQNWIVWDALSFPVRLIMPSHYSIICFSKGPSRPLPGLIGKAGEFTTPGAQNTFIPLSPLAQCYCLRSDCVRNRKLMNIDDRGPLTDLFWDIHRLKHNSRRVDHPCQLPPQLMYRLISIFTEPGEIVLDCFNGAGTTTLTAHQLNRACPKVQYVYFTRVLHEKSQVIPAKKLV